MFLLSVLSRLLVESETYLHNPVHQYEINNSLSIDYIQVYESNLGNNMPNLGFSTAFNEEYIINTTEAVNHNETFCELSCNSFNNCMGYFMFHNGSSYCNLLSNLGQAEYQDIYSHSFKKIAFHH